MVTGPQLVAVIGVLCQDERHGSCVCGHGNTPRYCQRDDPDLRSTYLTHTFTKTRASNGLPDGRSFCFASQFDTSQRDDSEAPMQLTGAQALIKSLEMEHTEVIFGLPGGAILPAYDPILDSPIRHVLVRHEQGAGHMAEGYAHVTGRPGVAMVTSGPGATNLVTPLCDAYMDSVPMVAITGQVSRSVIGTDSFQEADTVGITRSVTKHNELVMKPEDIALAVRQAFLLATTGRPGPVLLDIPKDILQAKTEWNWPTDDEVASSLPGYKPNTKGHPRMVREAVRLITASTRPVIYAGGGILKARAVEALGKLAELTNAPVVTTLMARGSFPDSHPQCLGMPGMHGNYTAIMAMQEADLLIALGARFDDRVTGKVSDFAPGAKIVHVDIDPAELGKIRRPDVPIVGDCRLVIEELVRVLIASGEPQPDRSPWWAHLDDYRARFPLFYEPQAEGELLKPQAVIEAIRDASPADTTVVAGRRPAPDVGQPVLALRLPLHLGELRGPRHHGLRGAGGDRGQGGASRPNGLGYRRRRLLPDDRTGARDRLHGTDPDKGGHLEQRLPGDGPPVAGNVLPGALLGGLPLPRPARLCQMGRSNGLCGFPGRAPTTTSQRWSTRQMR